jgi:hypothetical protein
MGTPRRCTPGWRGGFTTSWRPPTPSPTAIPATGCSATWHPRWPESRFTRSSRKLRRVRDIGRRGSSGDDVARPCLVARTPCGPGSHLPDPLHARWASQPRLDARRGSAARRGARRATHHALSYRLHGRECGAGSRQSMVGGLPQQRDTGRQGRGPYSEGEAALFTPLRPPTCMLLDPIRAMDASEG